MPPDASPRKLLLFADCELNLPMRMLWRNGVLQQVEPRVFDVLELLIENRDRVVSHKELHARVWTGMKLTDSALHRALTVLRRVLGAVSPADPIIRTVHRVGYQFVAPVTERSDETASTHAAGAATLQEPEAEVLAIGLLWRDAFTPHQKLRAIKDSFSAAVLHQVQQQAGLPAKLVFIDASQGPGLQGPAAGWAADFDAVATVDVHRDGNHCWLEWWAHRSGHRPGRSSLRGGQPSALLEPAAAGMAAAIAGPVDTTTTAANDDGFTTRLRDRAAALLAAQEWPAAERLFDLLATAHPGHRSALVGKVLAMVPQGSPQIEACARELLAHAEATGDPEARLVARYALALAHQPLGGMLADPELTTFALKAIDAAAADNRPLPDLESRFIYATAANMALRAPLDPERTGMLKRAAELSRLSGNRLRAATVLCLLSSLAWLRDETPLALDFVNDALHQLGEDPAPFSRLFALSALALARTYGGEVAASAQMQDLALERCTSTEMAAMSAYSLSALALAAVHVGDRLRLKHLVALLERGFQPALQADHPAKLACQACLALAEGQPAAAQALLWQMVEHPAMQAQQGTRAAWLLMLLRLELGPQGSSDGQRCLQQLGPMTHASSPLLEAWRQRTLAAGCARRGDSAGAVAALMEALSVAPGGMVQALCRLDAAWLWCERGEVNRADVLWAAAGHWATEHPIGLAVKARVLAQQGNTHEAADWQARALGAWRGARPAVQESLLQSYRRAQPGAAESLPTLQGFASDAWWA